jgi:hypothetical protein
MLFQRDALALAMQQEPRTQTEYDLDQLSDKLVVDVIYGVLEVRDDFGIEVRT